MNKWFEVGAQVKIQLNFTKGAYHQVNPIISHLSTSMKLNINQLLPCILTSYPHVIQYV